MKVFKNTIFLSVSLATSSFGADTFNLKPLPSEILGQIYSTLPPTVQANLEMTGDRLLSQKNASYMQNFIEQRIRNSNNPSESQTLYDNLPIDKTNPRGIYNLINHADRLLDISALQTPAIIDFLVSINIERALEKKFRGLESERYGYHKNLQEARTLLEKQVALGKQWAIEMKFRGLENDYPESPEKVRDFLEQQIALGNQAAIVWKFYGLVDGKYGYTQSFEEALTLLERQVALGKQWAIEKKVDGLAHGLYGYPENLEEEVRDFLEEEVALGNQAAIVWKFYGLVDGKYGYTQSFEEAHTLLDQQVALGKQWAIEKKFVGLASGRYGYTPDPGKANKFLLSVYGIKLIHPTK